ncbi:MAG TPA: transposase [Polyangiaceae bacterium]|nr:transposase [Polyangiaceae bacterium]
MNREHPRHVTLSVAIRSLRTQRVFAVVCGVIRAVNRLRGNEFRIVEFSVQSNHIHLMVEADNDAALSHGMQALTIRLVRRINRLLGRRGSLFTDRFHDRSLKTARAVRQVLAYIFANFRKHGTVEALRGFSLDPFSSAPFFDGFCAADFDSVFSSPVGFGPSGMSGRPPPDASSTRGNVQGQSRFLRGGWKREGLLSIGYWPASGNH